MVWSWPVDVNYHEVDEGPGVRGSGVRLRVLGRGLPFTGLLLRDDISVTIVGIYSKSYGILMFPY